MASLSLTTLGRRCWRADHRHRAAGHYFGTADLYLGYVTRFLAPGGQLAIAVPSVRRELRELGGIPNHIRACVGWEALSLHTADWWRFHSEQSRLVEMTAARAQPNGWADWEL